MDRNDKYGDVFAANFSRYKTRSKDENFTIPKNFGYKKLNVR